MSIEENLAAKREIKPVGTWVPSMCMERMHLVYLAAPKVTLRRKKWEGYSPLSSPLT